MKHIKTDTEDYYLDDRDRRQGEYKAYHGNGKLQCRCFFVDGKYHGENEEYQDNGQLRVHSFFVNGKQHGEYKSYYECGELSCHCFFVDGKFHSEYKSYCTNGMLMNRYFHVDDEDVTDEVKLLVSDISNITQEEKLILKLQLGLDL